MFNCNAQNEEKKPISIFRSLSRFYCPVKSQSASPSFMKLLDCVKLNQVLA